MKKIVNLIVLVLIFSSCHFSGPELQPDPLSMLTELNAGADDITPESFKTNLQTASYLQLVDCREAEEYEAGHIPGAINVPRGVIEFNGRVDNRRKTVFLYSNGDNRSGLCLENLEKMKFKDVHVVAGGFDAWKQAFPGLIETGPEPTAGAAPVKKKSSGGCGG